MDASRLALKHKEMRVRVLAAAREIVRTHGLARLTVHRLAQALELTPGALYRYFQSKDALIVALTVDVLAQFGAVAERARRAIPNPTPMRLAMVTILIERDLVCAAPAEHEVFSLLVSDPRTWVPNPREVEPVMSGIRAELMPVVHGLQSAGIGETFRRALALFAAFHGALMLRKQTPRLPGIEFDELVLDVLSGCLLGWGAEPNSLQSDLKYVAGLGDLVTFAGGM